MVFRIVAMAGGRKGFTVGVHEFHLLEKTVELKML